MKNDARQLLERHFDTAFSAPDGIKKLRELILSLAMQGKLVAQDPKDPPASELLKEIEAKKKSLTGRREGTKGKSGKIKELPSIKQEDVPYDLPEGWEWVRLGTFLQMINGRAFKPTDWATSGIPIVRIQNLNNHDAPFNYCDESDVKEQHIINDNEFLISWSGTPGTSFGAFIWKRGKAALNQHIFKCFQIGNPFLDEFLRLAINSRLDFLISQAQGAVGLKHVTKGTLEDMLLPMPPQREQQRIATKIDQLTARCDELEKLRTEREQLRFSVHTAALQQLVDTGAQNGHNRAWQFLTQHFEDLYTVKENVSKLRKAILQLAVMGKLSSRNQEDGPIDDLLSQVQKQRLKLKFKQSTESIETSTPLGYHIPRNWRWQRLDDLLVFGPKNGFSPRAVEYETKVRSLTLSATTSGKFKGEHSKFIDIEIPEDSELWLRDGDILVQRGNTIEYVGVPAVYHGKPGVFIHPDLMMKLRISSCIDIDYVYYAMSSEPCRDYLRSHASGTSGTMPKINQKTLKSLPLPIPPHAEQLRIVTKINQLMSLCDALEQQIESTTSKQAELLNSVMAQV